MKLLREYIGMLLAEKTLLLYHRTNNAAAIQRNGFTSKIKTGFGTEVYFSTSPNGEATNDYGNELVAIEIPEQYANLDDEFPDGERHYWVSAKDISRFGNLVEQKMLTERKLRVFDFDDTLAMTDSMIILNKASGETIEQTPAEWSIYKPVKGDEFDYSQFGGALKNPQVIKGHMKILRRVLAAGSQGRHVVILTARGDAARIGILDFLEDIGIDTSSIELVTLGNSDPQVKADWIEEKINNGHDDIYFIDDSAKNIKAVAALAGKYPKTKLRAQLV